jgi:3-deoxy-manno-octulosonate cytidylyltransferase (CMP-KDO synthetase)
MIKDFVQKSMHENCIGIAKISCNDDLESDSIVKIVKSKSEKLLYASRSAIPFNLNSLTNSKNSIFKHVGIYSYNKKGLQLLDSISVGKLEYAEKVEILRFLENDIEVKCVELDYLGYSIDTIQDYKKITNES